MSDPSAVPAPDGADEGIGGLISTFIFSLTIFLLAMPFWLLLRRKFPHVYFPRKQHDPDQHTFITWVPSVLLLRGKPLLRHSGMNALLLLEWKEMSLLFLAAVSAVGMSVTAPVYLSQASRLPLFDALTATAIPPDSNVSWVVFVFSLFISVGFLILLFFHRRRYVQMRACQRDLGGEHLLVGALSNIPSSVKDPEDIRRLIEARSECKVENVSFAWKSKGLVKKQEKRLKYQYRLHGYQEMLQATGQRPMFRPSWHHIPGLVFCYCHKLDAIKFYQRKLDKITPKMERIREKAMERREHSGFAFVVFRSPRDMNHVVYHWDDMVKEHDELKADQWSWDDAKPLEDLEWEHINSTRTTRWTIQAAVTLFIILLALFWTIPVALFSNLDNFANAPILGPIVTSFHDFSPLLYSIVDSLLPVLLELAVLSLMPYICFYASKPEKHHSRSGLCASAMLKYWIFIIFNFYIFYLLFSGGIDLVQTLLDETTTAGGSGEIASAFESLDWPLYGAFYCSYLITLGLYDAVFTFLRIKVLIKKYLILYVERNSTDEEKREIFAPYQFKYYVSFAKESVYFAMIMTFAPIVPMVALCGVLAYFMNYLADKNAIVMFCRYDCSASKRMIFRFAMFINVSMILTFMFWTFFFFSHGPTVIGWVCVPVYALLWIAGNVILFATRFYERSYFRKHPSQEEGPLLASKQSLQDVVHAYSWEYITSLERTYEDVNVRELLPVNSLYDKQE